MNIKKYPLKKTIITILIIFIVSYVVWDVSLKIINYFRMQGYEYALMEIIIQSKNENCEPFSVFRGEERINLINTDCLQNLSEE